MTTTIPDSHRDLLDSQVATFATVGADGRPQLSAVWFLADDEGLHLSLNTDRQKVRNLEHDPKVTFFILDPANPFRYLEVRGDAVVEPDPDYGFAQRVGDKYATDVRGFDAPGSTRVKVTIEPTRVNAIAIG